MTLFAAIWILTSGFACAYRYAVLTIIAFLMLTPISLILEGPGKIQVMPPVLLCSGADLMHLA